MERVVSGGLDLESITDAEFSKLVGQQVTIFQAMLKRHQDLVSALRMEIEVLKHELGDREASRLPSPERSPMSPLKCLGSGLLEPQIPVTSASFASGTMPLMGVVPSGQDSLAPRNDSITQSQDLPIVVKPRVSLKVQPFCDEESEEALWAVKKHGRDSRSPSERDLTSPQLQVGWRSASNDACGMKARKSGRSSIISDPMRPTRSVHAAAAARAKTAEAQRNGSRANTAGLPGVGPRAVSEPQGVGATHSTQVLAAAEIRVEAWDIWPELFFEAVVEERRASIHSYSAQKTRLSLNHGTNMLKSNLTAVQCLQAMVLPPDGKRRLFWLVFSLLLIAYDMVMVPLSVYELDTSSFETGMTVFSVTFWTIDFIVAFFVGYYESGTLELRPQKTALNYVKTWMMADLILLSFEWTDLIIAEMPSLPSLIRASRSLRILRFLRSAKLLRAAKLPSFIKHLPFVSRSEYITLSFGILKQLLGILFINHTIAAVWYLLGQGAGSNGWLAANDIPVDDWWYTFLISLHWSLTQFTPASMSVQPTNLQERAFNVTVVIFALVTFSSFVSSITNLMTHLRNLESAEAILFSKLEDFMQSRKFSFYLTVRVRRYLEQRNAEKRSRPEEGDIELLNRLSEPLMTEVHFEMHSPVLTKHPMFFAYSRLNEPAVMKLCHTAVKTISLSSEDYLFAKGETAKSMFFLTSGKLTYTMENGDPIPVQHPAYFSEMVLWTPWSHNGTMRARSDCKILLLDFEKFHEVVAHAKNCQLEVCKYAERAIHILNKYFNKDTRSDLNSGKYNERRMTKRVFPEGCLEVRPMWFMPMPPRSINRHNSTGGLLNGIRRMASAQQVEMPSDSDAESTESEMEGFGRPRRIMEDKESFASDTPPPEMEEEEVQPPERPPPEVLG